MRGRRCRSRSSMARGRSMTSCSMILPRGATAWCAKGASSTLSFSAGKVGEFDYYCSVAGHRAAGMEGRIQVMPGAREAMAEMAPRDHPRSGGSAGSSGARAAARGEGRPVDAGTLGRARHQVRLPVLDLQRPACPAPSCACAWATWWRCASPTRRTADDPLGGFPRRHRAGRRCRIHPDRPRRCQDGQLPRARSPASMSITAPRRALPTTSPMACMA